MSRRSEREELFKILFQSLLRGEELLQPLNLNDKSTFIQEIVKGVFDNLSTLKNQVTDNMEKWSIVEIGVVERTLLYIALYELSFTETDYRVVINEALEIAKKYGHENSGKFINGVLAKVLKKGTEKSELQ